MSLLKYYLQLQIITILLHRILSLSEYIDLSTNGNYVLGTQYTKDSKKYVLLMAQKDIHIYLREPFMLLYKGTSEITYSIQASVAALDDGNFVLFDIEKFYILKGEDPSKSNKEVTWNTAKDTIESSLIQVVSIPDYFVCVFSSNSKGTIKRWKNNGEEDQKIYEIQSAYNIACAKVSERIICFFLINSEDRYCLLDFNLTVINTGTLSSVSMAITEVTSFGYKTVNVKDNKFILCATKKRVDKTEDKISCRIGKIDNDNITPEPAKDIETNDYCFKEVRGISLTTKGDNQFYVCGYNTQNFIQYTGVKFDENSLQLLYSKLTVEGGSNSFSYLFDISGGKIGILYNTGGTTARIKLLGSEICEDYVHPQAIFVGSKNAGKFNLNGKYQKGTDTTSLKLRISPVDVYDNSKNNLKIYHSTEEITENSSTDYEVGEEFNLFPGDISGVYTYSFILVADGTPTRACYLQFTVEPCAEGCSSCDKKGDKAGTECTSCNNTAEYYSVVGKDKVCWHKDKIQSYYYLDEEDQIIKSCGENVCLQCNKYEVNGQKEQKCTKCDNDKGYYPKKYTEVNGIELVDCYLSSQAIEGYFFDPDKGRFEQCYEGCKTCQKGKIKESHNCTSCDIDNQYYPTKSGTINDGMCYNDATKPENYFFNKESNYYESCFEGCLSCETAGQSEDETNCVKCANNYFGIEDMPGQCYKSGKEIQKYYFDSSSTDKDSKGNTINFKKCPQECLTCEKGPQTVPCTKCDTDNEYYPLSDNQSKCVLKTKGEDYYYFSTNSNQFEKCPQGYIKCDLNNKKCDTANKYFPLVNKTEECHISSEVINGYFFDATNNVFEQCDFSCLTCVGKKTTTDTNCIKCDRDNNYFPIFDESGKGSEKGCYDKLEGYYLSGTSNNDKQFIKCNERCLTCETAFDHCIKCNTDLGYYPLAANPSECKKQTEISDGSQLIDGEWRSCYKSCKDCSVIGDVHNPQCTHCADGYFPAYDDLSFCMDDEIKDQNPKYEGYFYYYTGQYKKCSDECRSCKNSKTKCLICGANYYMIEGSKPPTKCYSEDTKPSNTFIDVDNYIKPCHSRCKACVSKGDDTNHKCTECDTKYFPNPLNNGRCEDICDFYYYLDEDNNNEYVCTEREKCPEPYKYLYPDEGRCYKTCDNSVLSNGTTNKIIFENKCLDECPTDTVPDENNPGYCKIVETCQKTLFSNYPVDLEDVGNKIDALAKSYIEEFSFTDLHVNIIRHVDSKYEITIFKNDECGALLSEDLTGLNLADCPNILRKEYGIPDNIALTTLKMSINREGQTSQLAYAFYNSITGEKLDLKYCKGEKIDITVDITETEGVNITEAENFQKLGVDVYNSSDPFFNDICIQYTDEDGNDMTLADRRAQYYQNVSFCEEGCTYNGVNMDTKEANCTCEVKTDFVTEIFDNPITGEFFELFSGANFAVFKCFNGVFSKNIIKNAGGWIICFIGAIEGAFTIIYLRSGIMSIRILLLKHLGENPPPKNILQDLIEDEKSSDNPQGKHQESSSNHNLIEPYFMHEVHKNSENENDNNKNNNAMILEENKDKDKSEIPQTDEEPSEKKKSKVLIFVKHDTSNSKKGEKETGIEEKTEEFDSSRDMRSEKRLTDSKKVITETQVLSQRSPGRNIISMTTTGLMEKGLGKLQLNPEEDDDEFSDDELNELDLYDAIKYDKRKFCEFYWGQLCEKQAIINTFFVRDELDCFPIKVMTFLLSIALYFTLNALFYSDSYISSQSETDEDGLIYVLKNEMSRCIYATIVAVFLEELIQLFFEDVKKKINKLLRKETDANVFRKESIRLAKKYEKRIIIFMITNGILMVLFWYYISAFCYCYKNSQDTWVFGSIITWVIVTIYPFLLCLIVASLRFLGMKCKLEVSYKISTCLSD